MTTIDLTETTLIIRPQGWHQLWALKRRLEIPLAHVRGARVDPETARGRKGVRMPGTHLPGVLTAGTFYRREGRAFWDVRDPEKAIVIDLTNDWYTKLVLEVAEPRATAAAIERARRRAG